MGLRLLPALSPPRILWRIQRVLFTPQFFGTFFIPRWKEFGFVQRPQQGFLKQQGFFEQQLLILRAFIVFEERKQFTLQNILKRFIIRELLRSRLLLSSAIYGRSDQQSAFTLSNNHPDKHRAHTCQLKLQQFHVTQPDDSNAVRFDTFDKQYAKLPFLVFQQFVLITQLYGALHHLIKQQFQRRLDRRRTFVI
jgi:hypothetical protein